MKNSIVIILIINCILLVSCAKDKKIEAVKKAKKFENELIDAIKKGNFNELKKDKGNFNIIDEINLCEKQCKDADTSYTINKEYLLQTAAINDKDSILTVFIENGVNPNASYTIKNDFDIDKEKKNLDKIGKEYTVDEVVEKIKEKNKTYIAYYEKIGALIEYNKKEISEKLKDGKVNTKNILELKITIENYAIVMSKIMCKEKSVSLLSKYEKSEENDSSIDETNEN